MGVLLFCSAYTRATHELPLLENAWCHSVMDEGHFGNFYSIFVVKEVSVAVIGAEIET